MNQRVSDISRTALRLFVFAALLLQSGPLLAKDVRVVCQPLRGPAVTVVAEVADTPALRARGLMHRKTLPEGRGMWFVFGKDVHHAFWMKDTYVSLDIIFVGADNKIVDIIPNTKPLSEAPLLPRAPYRYVLEVPAGFAMRHKLGNGDHVYINDKL